MTEKNLHNPGDPFLHTERHQISYESIMSVAKGNYEKLQPNYFEQIYIPSLDDARYQLRSLKENALVYGNEYNLPELPALLTFAQQYIFENASTDEKKQYRDPNVFKKKYISTLKGMLGKLVQPVDDGEIFARRKAAIEDWARGNLQIYEEQPDASVPVIQLAQQPNIILRSPSRPGKSSIFQISYPSTKDIGVSTHDYNEKKIVGGILSTEFIVEGKQTSVDYGIFIDHRALTEPHSLTPGAEDRRTMFQRRKHGLDPEDTSRQELLWWIRTTNLPLCTQGEAISRESFERDSLASLKNILKAKNGYQSQKQFKEFMEILPLELQEDLDILFALPHPEYGPFDVVSIGSHTLRMDTVYNSNPQEVDEKVVRLYVQRLTNFFHDVAKGVSIVLGVPHLQHDFTLVVMQKYLPEYIREKKIKQREMDMMIDHVNQDTIGDYIKVKITRDEAIQEFDEFKRKFGLSDYEALQHWEWRKKFYFGDAGNYENIACKVGEFMSEDEEGDRKVEVILLGLLSLDDMFILNKDPDTGELTGEIHFSNANSTLMKLAIEEDRLSEEEAHYDTYFERLDIQTKAKYAHKETS